MDESRTYKIVLTNETSQDDNVKTFTNTQGNYSSGMGSSGASSAGEVYATNMLKKFINVGTAEQVAMGVINYNVGKIELRTGSKEAQQRTSYAVSNLSSIVKTGAGALIATGGNVPVALLAVVLGLVSKATSLMTEYATQQENQTVQNIEQSNTLKRITTSGSRYQNATMEM